MKKMNIITMLVMLLIASSCSTDTVLEKYEMSKSEINSKFSAELSYTEIHLHQYFLEKELNNLSLLKKKLLLQIEEGDKDKIRELEVVMGKIKEYGSFKKYNSKFLGIIGPGLPRPPKPHPCNDPGGNYNCPIRLETLTDFWFYEFGEIQEVRIVNQRGQVVSSLIDLTPAEENEAFTIHSLEIKTGEKLSLEITKFFKYNNQSISYSLDVLIE